MRERAHVARALHVVLAAQRIHADAGPADVARRHGEVGDRHDRRRALAVLGDAEAVVDRRVAARGIKTGGCADCFRIDAGVLLHGLRRVRAVGDEIRPFAELIQSQRSRDERLVDETFRDDHVRHRSQHGDVGAGLQRQMIGGLDVRRAHEVDAARIDDDQLGALAQALLHAAAEHRVAVGRVGADARE